jgi:hypothetical protein
MTSQTIPSFHSAAIVTQHPAPARLPDATPWRGILAVEPDPVVLNAKSDLLTKANYCVTRATGERELFFLRGAKAFALAILSDRLGRSLLASVAATIRRQWPRTRILIIGQVATGLEDYLYDEQIYRSPDPRQVLSDLETLYSGMWNRRSNTLDWDAIRATQSFARPRIEESDPTKTPKPALLEDKNLRGWPSDIRLPATSRN